MLSIFNGQAVPIKDIPFLPFPEFRQSVLDGVRDGGRIIAFFGRPDGDNVRLFILLAYDGEGRIGITATSVGNTYPCLTTECAQAHWFEREIAEEWDILPEGHPWLKPVRFHAPFREGSQVWGRTKGKAIFPSATSFFQVQGTEVHEVAVGPVHAGIIEPGHFRFQCHGEEVFHLEISLGYQHRGARRAVINGPDKRTMHYMETLAGDTTMGHAAAYCQAVEALAACEVPARAQALRGIMLELERLANHAGDLGALANDVGYLPTASYCGRLRGDFLNMTALVCGNRFGRGMLRQGGVAFDLDYQLIMELSERLENAYRDLTAAVNLLWDAPSVVDRLEGTGTISRRTAGELGLVGPAARASGLERDVRFDFPTGIYRFTQIPVSTCPDGDVFSRVYVRWLEIQRSVDFIRQQLKILPPGAVRTVKISNLLPEALAVSLVEGWRGEICHIGMTGANGQFSDYRIVDPSFHNWMGLAMAMRGEEISNFPLCNKSFDLSYCGHDL
jgi:Ni,Fe-hydrogenase III large subunit